MDNRQPLRAVYIESGDGWVAQCVDIDIGAQGDTREIARKRLAVAVVAEFAECALRNVDPFVAIGKPPGEYALLYEADVASDNGLPVATASDSQSKGVSLDLCFAA